MIAELYGKVGRTNSNLTERLEDELTGNFFGNMRYLPFNKGLKRILMNCVFPTRLSLLFSELNIQDWDGCVSFWPWDKEAELDVLLTFDELTVGIEVKYKSPLSSDDEVDNSAISQEDEREVSCNQLAREARLLMRQADGKPKILLLLADESSSRQIYADTVKRNILSGITFGYITWQKALIELNNIQTDNPFEKVIIGDLIALLTRKGFERFKSFRLDTADINPELSWVFDFNSGNDFEFTVDNEVVGGMHYEFRN